jgi:outer membrane receptor protein involved in Fe transport
MKPVRDLLTLLLLAAPGLAQTPPQDPEADELATLMALLNTPVVSASKHEERAFEAPGVMSVGLRGTLDDYGFTSLSDYLVSLPGFSASQDYERSTLSFRGQLEGWNNNHLLLLVDGIPFNDNIYGSAYTWEITPLFLARTVEVVRGPGSALYGSNAMNGVVQLKTVSPGDLPGNGIVRTRMGQDGLRMVDAVLGRTGDRIATVVGLDTYQSEGTSYLDYDGSGRAASPGGSLAKGYVDDRRSSHYAWAKLEGLGDLRGWTFQYHLQEWNYRTGHGWVWQIPDLGEGMRERRQIASLAYAWEPGGAWHGEFLLRHQIHDVDWNTRYYPATQEQPGGVWERLDSGAFDDFLRAQGRVDLPRGSSLLAGFEADRFFYDGDRSHHANINLVTFAPNPGNQDLPAGPWLAYLKDRPVVNTGFYAQYDSGKVLGERFKAVLGLRADRMGFDANHLGPDGYPDGTTHSRSFSDVNPRIALVYMPLENLAFKLMGGKAFRAPSPSELAGANTLSLASNLETLRPETLTTYEFAVDWILHPALDWRTNVFRTRFHDAIAYSASNANLSTNVATTTTEGLETELFLGIGPWRGFLNFSYARLVDEQIEDTTVAPSQDLVWVPARTAKAGLVYASGPLNASVEGTWTSRVLRRSTDVGLQTLPLTSVQVDVDAYRPETVPPWFALNARIGYTFQRTFNLSLLGTNLLDRTRHLDKSLAFPFDYRMAQRQIALELKLTL